MKVFSFGNKVLEVNDKWLKYTDPYNMLDLPPFTIRIRVTNGTVIDPRWSSAKATQLSTSPNIWDVYYPNTSWYNLMESITWNGGVPYEGGAGRQYVLLEVLGANTTGVTSFKSAFAQCTALENVALFDTSAVTDMESMFANNSVLQSVPLYDTHNVTTMRHTFAGCHGLVTVPLFNTSNVTDMENMFWLSSRLEEVPLFDTMKVTNMDEMFRKCASLKHIPLFDLSSLTDMERMCCQCENVQGGALALYQRASSLPNVPLHSDAFELCGTNTQTGTWELNQIPSSWK